MVYEGAADSSAVAFSVWFWGLVFSQASFDVSL